MKISDFKGEAALDLIAEIIEPASAIFGDVEIRDTVTAEKKDDKSKRNIAKAAKIICTKYKTEVLEILAALDGVPIENYKPSMFEIIAKTMTFLSEAMSDIIPVFSLPPQTEEKPLSGSLTELTTGEKTSETSSTTT